MENRACINTVLIKLRMPEMLEACYWGNASPPLTLIQKLSGVAASLISSFLPAPPPVATFTYVLFRLPNSPSPLSLPDAEGAFATNYMDRANTTFLTSLANAGTSDP